MLRDYVCSYRTGDVVKYCLMLIVMRCMCGKCKFTRMYFAYIVMMFVASTKLSLAISFCIFMEALHVAFRGATSSSSTRDEKQFYLNAFAVDYVHCEVISNSLKRHTTGWVNFVLSMNIFMRGENYWHVYVRFFKTFKKYFWIMTKLQ